MKLSTVFYKPKITLFPLIAFVMGIATQKQYALTPWASSLGLVFFVLITIYTAKRKKYLYAALSTLPLFFCLGALALGWQTHTYHTKQQSLPRGKTSLTTTVLAINSQPTGAFKKRLLFLLGKSPLPKYEDYFDSCYPFYGHNREMTVDEVRYLMNKTGFQVKYLDCYDYGIGEINSVKGLVAEIVKKIAPFKNKGGSIIAKCTKTD